MALLKVHIEKAGLFTSIQDKGRKGLRYYGIPVSGYMDAMSAELALKIVGNEAGSSLLEINQLGPTLRFDAEAQISICGGKMDNEYEPNVLHNIPRDKIIKLGSITEGMRAYLAIRGSWKVPAVFGSSSAYSYDAFGIGRIKDGAHLEIQQKNKINSIHFTTNTLIPDLNSINCIKINPGPEYDYLDTQSKEALQKQTFSMSLQNNRMGAKLTALPLTASIKEIPSSAVFPGTLQLLPSGEIVVLLQDGQTTGGYPRIGIIPEEELWKFCQLRAGQQFRFTNSEF